MSQRTKGLIRLVQINGGKKLRDELDSLLLSYEASKVLFDDERNLVEVIEALDTLIETKGESLENLEQSLIALKNKEIHDRVRILSEYKVEDEKVDLPEDLATLVPDMQEKTVSVYYTDNKPVVGENGKRLTLDLETGKLSGKPHTVADYDEESEGDIVYTPVLTDVAIKFFPIGVFKFSELPAEYLLDNEEFETLAYSHAIDKISYKLSKNDSIINEIKQLVGEQAVQDQIKEITNELNDKIDEIEKILGDLPVDEEGVALDIGSVLSQLKEDIEETSKEQDKKLEEFKTSTEETLDKLQKGLDKASSKETIAHIVENINSIELGIGEEYELVDNSISMIINGLEYPQALNMFELKADGKTLEWISDLFELDEDFDTVFVKFDVIKKDKEIE